MARKKEEIKEIIEKIVEADFNETMKKSYLDYAVEVITARAVPDIRDGLKPVQRKSIYTLEQLGIFYNKPYKKAARVVGECMGKYHPHGDSSIYEAMVRMSQEFQNSVPLIDGHGNWGAIDGSSAAAMRYCVAGDTLIPTNEGLIPISEIIETKENSDNDINIEVKSFNKNNKASKFFNSGKHKTYTIVLKNGMSITGTLNHPLLILNDKFQLEWKLLENINIGDKCLVDLNTKNSLYGNNNDLLEAKMLGAMISEGYITTQNRIGINNKNLELIYPVKEFFEREINAEANINKVKNYYEYCIDDRNYFDVFKDKYSYKESAKDKIIPKQVLKGTKEYQKEFLRYLFEGDGSVTYISSPYSKKDIVELSYSSYSEKLICQLQILLASQFGIFSRKQNYSKRNEIKLIISGKYIQKFKKEIGFVSQKKNNILNLIPKIYSSKNSFYSYNELTKYIKNIDSKIKRNITTIEEFENFESFFNKDVIEYVKSILTNYEAVSVSNIIENNEEQNVYSIRVDSECHSFSGNGFINHNTECRLQKIGSEMVDGLKDKIVPFMPNFDEEEEEPTILPCRFPNLLVNGTSGIAVGLTSSIPTHNLRDSISMIDYYMKKIPTKKGADNPCTIAELLDILKGPDFPTGGTITNPEDLLEIYKTGEGKIFVRAKIEQETSGSKQYLIITEIPFTYSGRESELVNKISTVILNKKIPEITEVKDESSKEGLRIVLELKKDSDIEKVKNKLYKLTPLQDTFTVRLVGLIGTELKTFSLKDYCKYFVEFQDEIYTKEYEAKQYKLLKKKEIFEGLVKAFDYIDIIIDLIRHAEKVEYAKRCLMTGNINNIKFTSKKNEQVASKFKFTEIQAESILETTLRKLNQLEITDIQDTLREIEKELDLCNKILSNKKELYKVISTRLLKISKEYGRDRRTSLTQLQIVEYKEEEVIENVHVVYDRYGYIKCFDEKTAPKIDETITENCKYNNMIDTSDNLWCFSDLGTVYQIKMKELPFNKLNDRGTLLETKVGKKIDGDIIFVTNKNTEGKLIFVTEKGFIKIVDKKEFESTRTVTSSTKLNPNDKILKILEIKDEDKILICNEKFYLNFEIKEISELKKTSVGIVSIKMTDKDIIKDVVIYNKDTETIELNKKQYKTSDLKTQKRGTKGVKI